MDDISLAKQILSEIGTVLTGDPSNERNFIQRHCPTGKPIPIVMGFLLTKHEIAPYQNRPAVKSNVRALIKHLPDANPAEIFLY